MEFAGSLLGRPVFFQPRFMVRPYFFSHLFEFCFLSQKKFVKLLSCRSPLFPVTVAKGSWPNGQHDLWLFSSVRFIKIIESLMMSEDNVYTAVV